MQLSTCVSFFGFIAEKLSTQSTGENKYNSLFYPKWHMVTFLHHIT